MKPIKILLVFICIFCNTFLLQAQLPELIPYNKYGKREIIPARYYNVYVSSDNLYIANSDNEYEFYNSKGMKITFLRKDKETSYYLRHPMEIYLIKTDLGYVGLNGIAYFE